MSAAHDKIRKLLNMTVENGCTEDEQETALRMAAGLAAREGIELESVRQKDASAPKRKASSKTLSQEWKIHQVLAAQAAAELYGVQVYTFAGGKQGIFFVGREENIELTEQTMFWLMRQVELLYKEHLPRGMTQRDRAEYRKTFKAACANRVFQRSRELMFQMRMNQSEAQRQTGQNALVVRDYFKTLSQENSEYFTGDAQQQEQRRLKEENRRNSLTVAAREEEDREIARREKQAANRKGPRPRHLPTGNGTNAGRQAGDRVQLRKEIT